MGQISIGDRVRHVVQVGFAGVVVGVCEYMNGCRQALVLPEKPNDQGAFAEGVWIDEQYLALVEAAVHANPFAAAATPASAGGPDHRSRPTH